MAIPSAPTAAVDGVTLIEPILPGDAEILTPAALAFVAGLCRRFRPRLEELLELRTQRQRRLAAGEPFDFLASTAAVRATDWTVGPLPADLMRRVVEITGPVERKMIINALNSGADVFMADFEDSNAPTWRNNIDGQIHLAAAVRRTLTHHDPASGKSYRLEPQVATLMVRPRGLHLLERHLLVDGIQAPAPWVDFGLFFFHNAREQIGRGTGPYFYLPKLQSHLEARLWNQVFLQAQEALGIPHGSIKATVLIETLPAAFEMDEILHELREHSAGLNCGRWDYIFSFIKSRRHEPQALLPDRSQITMTQPCMRAYTQLVVRTCHRRGVHAIGGMAAQIPIKSDPDANQRALAKVRADKDREVGDGHDGTWVAHPGLVAIARDAFAQRMTGPHQLDRRREDVQVSSHDLLQVPEGTRTEAGLRLNVRVGIQYLEAWLRGIGCVPLDHLMEDAATAEISRTQVWQWIHWGATLDDGRVVSRELLDRVVDEELQTVEREVGSGRFRAGRFGQARDLFVQLCVAEELEEFLTVPAYALLDLPHTNV